MKAVNLLPREISGDRGRRRVNPSLAGGVAVTAAVVAAVAGGYVLAHGHAQTEQQKLTTAHATLVQLQAQQAAAETTLNSPAVLSQAQSWQAALTTALSTRIPWDHTLTELSHVVPADVTFSSLSFSGATAATGGTLTLEGTTSSEPALARLLSRLMLLPDLSQVELNSSSTSPTTGDVSFQLQAQVTA